MDCRLVPSDHGKWPDTVALDNEGLAISFRRTIRVPETETVSALPPDLGAFPLYSVNQFEGKLPRHMSAKGGLFFPMHSK